MLSIDLVSQHITRALALKAIFRRAKEDECKWPGLSSIHKASNVVNIYQLGTAQASRFLFWEHDPYDQWQ